MHSAPRINLQRRNFLVLGAAAMSGVLGASCGGSAGSAGPKTQELANVHSFQGVPGSDWTAAANAAVATARRVYFPRGEYLLDAVDWPANTEIFGDGDATVLRMPAKARYLFTNDSGSRLEEQNIVNLYMHDVQLRASSDMDGFSEFRHLVSLNGVTNARFRNVLFRGFRGDGLYIGSGNDPGVERHNRDIVVENCRFDGINRANRNGITVIDCDGLLVQGCHFQNMTAANMPGAIDLEPDKLPFHVIKNVRILNNQFEGIGGFTGVVAVTVPAEVELVPTHITVEGNKSVNYVGTGPFFFFNAQRLPTSSSTENRVRLLNNTVIGGVRPFLLSGRDFLVQGNVFQDFTHAATLGFTDAKDAVLDVELRNNLFLRCGSVGGAGVSVYTGENLRFIGNRFVDCGSGKPLLASAVAFFNGRSVGVSFSENEFTSPTGKTLAAISKDAMHSFASMTNSFAENKLNGLSVTFQAKGL